MRRVSVAAAIVIVAAVVGTLLARGLVGGGERASLTVTVAGRSAHVVEGTTLAGRRHGSAYTCARAMSST